MCDLCRKYPCHPSCPNADEPKEVCKCDECNQDILEGDDYYKIDERVICTECIDNFKVEAEAPEDHREDLREE